MNVVNKNLTQTVVETVTGIDTSKDAMHHLGIEKVGAQVGNDFKTGLKDLGDSIEKTTQNATYSIGALMVLAIILSVFNHQDSLWKKKRYAKFEHKLKQQRSLLYKSETTIDMLQEYKNELVVVAPAVAILLAYATIRSHQRNHALFQLLYVKHPKYESTAKPEYENDLKRLDKKLHRIFFNHKYVPISPSADTHEDGGQNMQELRYHLLLHKKAEYGNFKSIQLQHKHFFYHSGHLRNTPGGMVACIKQNHTIWHYLRDIPKNMFRKGKGTLKAVSIIKRKTHKL